MLSSISKRFFNFTFVSYNSIYTIISLAPNTTINKDFFRGIFRGDKKLLTNKEVRKVNAPKYDELGVCHLWKIFKDEPKFARYFPDRLPKNRLPDREYFFNVLNTVYPDYCDAMIKHAND